MREKKNGEVSYSLADHIWEVLKDNLENGNPFLNESQIALRVASRILNHFPDDRYADTVIQPKTIKTNMGRVRDIADVEGCTVVADRKMASDNGDPLRGWIILGWHIADETDEEYIRKEIAIRQERSVGYEGVAERISGTATKQGLIPPSREEAIEQ